MGIASLLRLTEMMHHRCEEQAGISNTSSYYNIRTGGQRGKHRFDAKIGVGGNDIGVAAKRTVRFDDARILRKLIEHIVAGYDGDLNRDALLPRHPDNRAASRFRTGS